MFSNNLVKLISYRCARIHSNRWAFTSLNGDYSDSPRAISEYLHQTSPNIEINWLVKKEQLPNLPQYVNGYDINSVEGMRIKGSCQVVVDNVFAGSATSLFKGSYLENIKRKFLVYIKNKRNQHVYTTFHGTPLKYFMRDQKGNEDIVDFISNDVTLLAANQLSLDILKHVTFNKLTYQLTGMPRNDKLVNGNVSQEEAKKVLGIDPRKKVLLFAPTFRNDGKGVAKKNIERSGLNQLNAIDFNQLFEMLSKKFDGEWVFVCRFHYHVEHMVNWEEIKIKYKDRVINGNVYADMIEYLLAADMLISDASSCIYDFAITHKPCFLFFPDYDNYAGRERGGFYIPIHELPFPLSTDFDALLHDIETMNMENYYNQVEALLDRIGNMDDGNASKRVVEYILNDINGE